ncbi:MULTISPECIES: DUF4349 domain-containing protein [Bacillaceae]|uniref:DUF4349 domain-containing protein n=1 Tax=Evansella alkalicola TaxID=745819 RepID=A0ABS6JR75_9BACI|nr:MULTISPECIES: DUF4349 domain-containing protein [Bacillaceae]MBU9721056.1 DUF4349 domain-containing protein [Bacillus alkalicola]
MKNNYFVVFLAMMFLTISILFGCSSNDDMSADEMDGSYEVMETEMYASDDSGGLTDESLEESGRAVTTSNNTGEDLDFDTANRMVIYNANMSIEVTNFQQAQLEIQNHVEKMGGFIIESNQYSRGEDNTSGYMSVRVPQNNFYPFLDELESSSTKVNERSVWGNDVTEEYVDLESRLRSREAVEERLLSFMEEAENTEDLLKISSDLGKIQQEIEQLTGRMKYLEDHVAFSTVTVHIEERNIKVPSLQETDTLNTWKKAQSLFMDTVNFIISIFSSAVVILIGLSPIIVPILVLISILLVMRRRKKRATQDNMSVDSQDLNDDKDKQ